MKVWTTAAITDAETDPDLATRLTVEGYAAKVERSIVLTIQAYDWNCPQHIPPRYTSEEIALEVARLNPDVINPCGPDSKAK